MMSAMQTVFAHWLQNLRQYLYLCLLSSSPERLIFNPRAFALTVFAYFALAALLVDAENGFGAIASRLLLELVMLALVARGTLHLKGMSNRFAQTYSALVGINLIVTAVHALLQFYLVGDIETSRKAAFYLFIAVLVWNLSAMSLVFQRALEIPAPLAAMLSFGYFIVYYVLVVSLL
jgi:hypothetical protein